MAVEITYPKLGRKEVLYNSSTANPQDPVSVTVELQDLPPNSDMQVTTFLRQLPNRRYVVTGYLIPHNDSFNIEPSPQIIRPGHPYELIRVYHDDMRRYRPNGLPVRARTHVAVNNFQPTPEEDAIIQPR